MHRYLIAVTLVLVLAGCAGTPPAPEASGAFTEGRDLYLAKDYDRAFPLILEAANAGQPEAQYAVGYMYYLGQGVERDTAQGLEWIRVAAKAGEPRAIEALGRLAGQRVPAEE